MNSRRRSFVLNITICVAVSSVRALAQQPKRLPRVALVLPNGPSAEMAGADPANAHARAFVHALRDLGLIERRNIIIERRSAEGRFERLAALMQELIALDVDVIVTIGPGVRAAQQATDRIAIVGLSTNVLDSGLIESLAHPGHNLTGFGHNFPVEGKLLEVLKEAAPTISRVAVISSSERPGPRASWRVAIDSAARSLRLDVQWQPVDELQEFEPAFATIVRERANALLVANTTLNEGHLRLIADFGLREKLPSVCIWREFAEAGGLLSYGDDFPDAWRHAAADVKKILDGAKPGDLPWEQPTRFELVINLKTAKAIRLAIPQTLLRRADEVIQ